MDKTQGRAAQSRPCFKLTHYIFKATEKKVSQWSMVLRFCGIGSNRSSENGFVRSCALWAGENKEGRILMEERLFRNVSH
ncbi:hypothetical protein HMPREF9418_1031 [Neisseria macacae ATCC 33926]|uniref:Uncharacterized protein n=1 Tax=Neisseria macacae ATCC 33926 TaxID=997348 RepID=A0AA36UK15_9NEIS|nr:hypothetical protein HMPREF9418_1031 [Neisseria macacae ATCC 33926]